MHGALALSTGVPSFDLICWSLLDFKDLLELRAILCAADPLHAVTASHDLVTYEALALPAVIAYRHIARRDSVGVVTA